MFYWILFLRPKYYELVGVEDLVSILVLLDFVLKGVNDSFVAVQWYEFQSLFYWILFLRTFRNGIRRSI